MHTPETEREPPGLGETAKNVAEHASTLARLELELAGLELKRKLSSLGLGIGLALGAAVMLLFVVGFGLATMAAGIATATPTWVALLIVTAFVALITAVLGLLGMRAIKKGTPPVPEQALEEARLTTEALKADGRDHV
jgi:tetrahydromethanopterin S-methyltransferase subunit C